jgi:hypothetical protein
MCRQRERDPIETKVRLVAGGVAHELVAGHDTRAQDPAVRARLVPTQEVERLHARVRPLIPGGGSGGSEQRDRADSISHLEGEVQREVRAHPSVFEALAPGSQRSAARVWLRRGGKREPLCFKLN